VSAQLLVLLWGHGSKVQVDMMNVNQLIPELSVSNLQNSLAFYVNILSFEITYQRAEEGFAFLSYEGVQLMLDEINQGRTWCTDELVYPLGRGINFQIMVSSVEVVLEKLREQEIDLFLPLEEKWYRRGDKQLGFRQFLVMDPDGYLLRYAEFIGSKNFIM
jgi:catechol 2,3-dioxygenase-like lactoylglutathione lyase family enzyme